MNQTGWDRDKHPRIWVIDDYLQDYSISAYDAYKEAQSIVDWEVSYDNDLECGKRTRRQIQEGSTLERTMRVTDRELWMDYVTESDPYLHGGGVHVMSPGGWLQVHLDYSRHPKIPDRVRAVNLILFLNPEWKPEWGGALLMCDASGAVKNKIYPAPGRLVVFETTDLAYHGVEELSDDAPERVTIAVYRLIPNTDARITRTRALFMPNRNPNGCPHEVKYGVPIAA